MRYWADTDLRERTIEVSRHLQSWYRPEGENYRSFSTPPGHKWSQRPIFRPSSQFYDLPVSSMTFPTLPPGRMWPVQLIPIIFRKSLNIFGLSAFVGPSASRYTKWQSLPTLSQIQCQRTSMCFIFWWNSGLSVSEIAPLLSARRSTGWLGRGDPRQATNRATHKAFFPSSVVTMYSTSVDDNATVLCNFDWWDKSQPDSMKI